MTVTEVMHSASLAHDDIQDHDLARWGRPTLNRLFGMEQAINVGDAMIGMVYQLLLGLRSKVEPEVLFDVIDVFNRTHLRMCEGQHLDLTYKFYEEVGVAEYLDMVLRKTAAPCVCIAQAISALASCPKETRETLSRFGQSLGMLYQICDDIRGIWCEADALGRQVGQDICQQRASLPLLYAFQRGSSHFRKFLKEKVAGRDTLSREELEYVKSQLKACGAYDLCHRDASHHYQRAVGALKDLKMDVPEVAVLLLILSSCYASVDFAGREAPRAVTE
jgi:geranylgeranyl diphosphate synthase type I